MRPMEREDRRCGTCEFCRNLSPRVWPGYGECGFEPPKRLPQWAAEALDATTRRVHLVTGGTNCAQWEKKQES